MVWYLSWWAWGIAALFLAFAELLLPSYVFLGFAIGAGAMSLSLLAGGGWAEWLTGSPELMLLCFAVLSLVAWLVLRRVMGVRPGQVKIIDQDINDG